MQNFWKIINKNTFLIIFNVLVIFLLLLLPHYIFAGKLYLGGDDSKLMYSYPFEFLQTLSFYSWSKFSSVSVYDFPQFRIPFLLLASLAEVTIGNNMLLNYFIFSLPLIVGFIAFQYMAKLFFKDSRQPEVFIGGLLYVFSPIILINQLANFYSAVWLIPLIPIIVYCLIKYLSTSNVRYVLLNILLCTFFSFGLASIPWIFGILLPVIIGLVFLPVFFINVRSQFKKIVIFFSLLVLSQAYWIIPFLSASINTQKNSLGEKILSYNYDGFVLTVLSTATGTIIYPLLNLFHRQIAFDYHWHLENIFINYYDKIYFFNIIFVVLIFFGFYNFKLYLSKKEKKIYLFMLVLFLLTLFLFTVSIGPLKNIFLFFGHIPGFIMFRNFFDKFALAFNIIYSILLTFSLVIVGRVSARVRIIAIFFVFILIIINILPIKQIINQPLWTTKNISTNVLLSDEYINFTKEIKNKIQPTSNILTFPFNSGSHAFIKEDNSNNSYVGTSPLIVFTGINDFSGDISFRAPDSARFNQYLISGNKKGLEDFFRDFNINYVFVTKNVSREIKNSYLLVSKDLSKQDENFINLITKQKIIESEKGNYILYSTENQYPILSFSNMVYERINPIMYRIHIKNFSGKKELVFKDAFNKGWKLYIEDYKYTCNTIKTYPNSISECASRNVYFAGSDGRYLLMSSLFDDTHKEIIDYGNKWVIDANYIKNNLNNKSYKQNVDGTINFSLTLYFIPQYYFYFGVIVSLITFCILIYYLLFKLHHEKVT